MSAAVLPDLCRVSSHNVHTSRSCFTTTAKTSISAQVDAECSIMQDERHTILMCTLMTDHSGSHIQNAGGPTGKARARYAVLCPCFYGNNAHRFLCSQELCLSAHKRCQENITTHWEAC